MNLNCNQFKNILSIFVYEYNIIKERKKMNLQIKKTVKNNFNIREFHQTCLKRFRNFFTVIQNDF